MGGFLQMADARLQDRDVLLMHGRDVLLKLVGRSDLLLQVCDVSAGLRARRLHFA